jgi:hypothetical protein
MAAPTARILAAAFLEGDNLGAAHMVEDLGCDARPCNRRCPHDRRVAASGVAASRIAADHQNLAEFHHRARLGFKPVDLEHVLRGDPVLLAARLDDREHLYLSLCSSPDARTRRPDRLFAIYLLRRRLGSG